MCFKKFFYPFPFFSRGYWGALCLSLAWGTPGWGAEVVPNERVIPQDKGFSAEWVSSLYERGTPEVVSSPEGLMHVGMPVGGLFCGTVYLGGDGKLWLWDVFNDNREGVVPKVVHPEGLGFPVRSRDGAAYVEPESTQPSLFKRGFPLTRKNAGVASPNDYSEQDQFHQGFALKVGDKVWSLDRKGWKNVRFTGTYPIGTVDYEDSESPVSVRLEGFSPFIPLNTDDSSLPCTVMSYTITNHSSQTVTGCIGGWLENAVCGNSGYGVPAGVRVNKAVSKGFPHVAMTAEGQKYQAEKGREDVVFEDFEKEDYAGWKAEGAAFANSPLESSRIPPYMGDIGMQGGKAAVSHNVREGGSIEQGDAHTGSLTSGEFTIDRKFINFLIAGGNHQGQTGLRLLIGGKEVLSATGHNGNKLRREHLSVAEFQGKKARLQVFDLQAGGWGNIIVDDIVFSDSPGKAARPMEEAEDYGSFCLSLADSGGMDGVRLFTSLPTENTAQALFDKTGQEIESRLRFDQGVSLAGISREFSLPAGKSVKVTFVLSWYFPNIYLGTMGDAGRPDGDKGKGKRHYASRFNSAAEVAEYVNTHKDRLMDGTALWRDTWYDSTLPYWFLDRTFANTSTLATTTCHRFTNGRFYAWEGIGSCPGTCTHVWQYAQAPSRLFPDIERYTREYVDLGIGFSPETGRIAMRAEHHMGPAVDGQCGRIMGIWREHTMSPDNEFLKRVWPRARKAVQFILDHDGNGDGILDGAQENTLDAAWYGEIAWISIEALGALKAGEEMALAMGDMDFASECRARRLAGGKNIEEQLFNGKWFFQKKDQEHANVFGTYNASFIDQMFGQSMAYQCGLGAVISPEKQKTALKSIWGNNFAKDLSEYLKLIRPFGRPYYVAGEGGTLMCTNALNEENPYGGGSWTAGYLNECMTGFEHQLASHMMHEGMVEESLAVTRAIHDRYNAEKRNPYNEVECSDHYSRAMASYGTYLNACGYQYNGPKGELSFSPRVDGKDFKGAFTTAEGWGSYAQKEQSGAFDAFVALKYGTLVLTRLTLPLPSSKVVVSGDGVEAGSYAIDGGSIVWKKPLLLKAGQTLMIKSEATGKDD